MVSVNYLCTFIIFFSPGGFHTGIPFKQTIAFVFSFLRCPVLPLCSQRIIRCTPLSEDFVDICNADNVWLIVPLRGTQMDAHTAQKDRWTHTRTHAHTHAHTRTHTRARALTQTLQEREREGNEVYCVCILGYSKWRNWRAICITGWTWWKRKWKVSGVSIYFNSLSLYNAKCCLFVFSMMYLWVIFILYFMPISNPVSRFVILCVCFCALYFTHARKEQRETSIICIQFRTWRNDQ